jgi:hypothetical protein
VKIVGDRKRGAKEGTLEAKLAEIYVDQVYDDLREILRLIIEGVHEKLVSIP